MSFTWKDWEHLDSYDKTKLKRFGKRPETADDNHWNPTEYIMKMTDKPGKDTYTLAVVLHDEMIDGNRSYKIVTPHIETHQDGKEYLYGQLELLDWIKADEVELYEKPADLKPPPSTKPRKRALTIGGKKSRKNKKSRKLRKKTIKN